MLDATVLDVRGFEQAIKGMRNSRNSWSRMDSVDDIVGPNDLKLMNRLFKSGTEHRKYARMITVWIDINAPLYWWKEFDTYKVGTVSNSCSTMHKITSKEFTEHDFSTDRLGSRYYNPTDDIFAIEFPGEQPLNVTCTDVLRSLINILNYYRKKYIDTGDKEYWWKIIQLLPSSYNQTRNVMLNYEVLANIYKSRKNHKLDEWREFCIWIEGLPYSDLITG